MAKYPISVLKNRITDRIHDNHARRITGPDLQEVLHDIIDSASGTGAVQIFPGWHGQEYPANTVYYRYLAEFTLYGLIPSLCVIRAKSTEGAGIQAIQLRLITDANLLVFESGIQLSEEYSIYLLPLENIIECLPLMIEYKSSQAFNIKEIILL